MKLCSFYYLTNGFNKFNNANPNITDIPDVIK